MVNHRFSDDDIEVPEGATQAFRQHADKYPVGFLKVGQHWSSDKKYWVDRPLPNREILWQRDTQQVDNINHPSHYTSDPSGVECIEITRHRNFNIGNAIKYLWRNGLKDSDSQVQDLQKAAWYINDEIKRLESITKRDSGEER